MPVSTIQPNGGRHKYEFSLIFNTVEIRTKYNSRTIKVKERLLSLQSIAQSIQDWMQASPSLKAEQQDEALRVLTALLERGLVDSTALTNGGAMELFRCLQESVPSPAVLRFVVAIQNQGENLGFCDCYYM